ncbi:RNA helicase [Nowakowskiella sp. JEL0407]|nr:RNA helicase [Nowakowskiella sp. JEL0407]
MWLSKCFSRSVSSYRVRSPHTHSLATKYPRVAPSPSVSVQAVPIPRFRLSLPEDLKLLSPKHSKTAPSTFSQLNIHPSLCDAIKSQLNILSPNIVQQLAIPSIFDEFNSKRSPVLIAGETGCGKTLAFLAPVMSILKTQEEVAIGKIQNHPEVDDIPEDYGEFPVSSRGRKLRHQTQAPPPIPKYDFENDPLLDSILDGNLSIPDLLSEKQPTTEPTPTLPTPETLSLAASIRKLHAPRALIIVPTRDLVTQTHTIAKSLSHVAKLRVVSCTTKTPQSKLTRDFSTPVDILISSPKSALNLITSGTISLTELQFVVIDEADTLVDIHQSDGETDALLSHIHHTTTEKISESRTSLQSNDDDPQLQASPDYYANKKPQIVFSTATIPKPISQHLLKKYPDIVTTTTPNLHCPAPTSRHTFMYIDASSSKISNLVEILRREVISFENSTDPGKKEPRVLVFCNLKETASGVDEELRKLKFDSRCVTSATDFRERSEVFKDFVEVWMPENPNRQQDRDGDGGDVGNNGVGSLKKGVKIIVCTDIASRGINTTACTHVILYDFPQTATDYLHRAGRTARYERGGKVTSLVARREKKWAVGIEAAVRNAGVVALSEREWRKRMDGGKKGKK